MKHFIKTIVNTCHAYALRAVAFVFAMFSYVNISLAQTATFTSGNANASKGASALGSAATSILTYLPYVQKIVYVIAGIVIVVSSLVAFFKMNNDDQDTKKNVMLIIGSCIFIIIAVTFLPQMLGITSTAAS